MTIRQPDPDLQAFVTAELNQPTLAEATAFAASLGAKPGVAAVLFYGSCLQRGTTEGMLDFYALTDSILPYGQNRISAAANRILPPNVYPENFQALKAKVAVVPFDVFHQRMSLRSWDTTFWARFCQRTAIVWARDDAARAAAAQAVTTGVETAAIWAERLTPGTGGVAAWRGLFAKTYKVEIRVERPGRAADIVGADEDRFAELWPLTGDARAKAPPASSFGWTFRWLWGKPLHVSRLLKAAFTFEGGPQYLLWKIRRHRRR
ncbi:MAG: hypothetical protein AAF367_04820 [Pseudomonadota bacterium]